uniref:F-ATPase gamma subunit n=1 Tax=Manihot esculenta TaxID=3983 RepID=A0A2C9UL02_MANES
MAMAALRREGRRFVAPLASPQPMTAIRSSLIAEEQTHVGARSISTQVVRNRMKSVKNIQKITKAMKMVAASKLRAIQTRAENSRGLWQPFTALLGDAPSVDVKKNVIVTISSDKGLCGGINSTSVKISKALHKLTAGPEKETKYVILGEKVVEKETESGGKLGDLDSYEIEGGETKGEILQNLAEFQFSCVLFNAVLENACSEQGARMSAMDSSSRNAGEMLDRLTLTYNRTRQASITTELIEIISGASALEG